MDDRQHKIAIILTNHRDVTLLQNYLLAEGHHVQIPDPALLTLNEWSNFSVVFIDEVSAAQYGKTLIRAKKLLDVFIGLIIVLQHKNQFSQWLASGFDDGLNMPVTKAELHARLRLFLNLRNQSDALKRKKEAILKALVGSSSDHIYLLNRQGTFLMSNDKARIFLKKNHPVPSLTGCSIEKIYPSRACSIFREKLEEVFSNKCTVTFEQAIPQGNGGDLFIQHTLYPVLVEGFPIQAVGGISRDITRLKQTEKKLQESLLEKEALLRELYHRTKNNMQVIISMLHLRSLSIKDETLRRVFQELENKIQAMSLVHQKLYQSKELSQISLDSYIKDLVELLVGSYKKQLQNIKIITDLKTIRVTIDTAIPCGLILNELISNSFKHAFKDRRSGVIAIRLHPRESGKIELTVTDNGVGLPKNFDLEQSNTLGLQTIWALVTNQLQGKLSFQGEKGATFKISFPIKKVSKEYLR